MLYWEPLKKESYGFRITVVIRNVVMLPCKCGVLGPMVRGGAG